MEGQANKSAEQRIRHLEKKRGLLEKYLMMLMQNTENIRLMASYSLESKTAKQRNEERRRGSGNY